MESPKRDHLKVPQRIHYKIASLTYNTLQTSQHYSPTYHHPTTRGYSLIIISFLVSPSSLILCEVCNRSLAYAAPALWNLRQFVHPPNPHLNFSYPPLAPSSATFHSRLKTELFKVSYLGSTPAPPTMKWEVWLLRTGFGIAPVGKLVSLTWLLWALKSFWSFTLHYITLHYKEHILEVIAILQSNKEIA